MQTPEVILLDLGGVLVRLGSMVQVARCAGVSPDIITRRWQTSEVVREFEAGRISFDRLADVLLSEWNIPLTKAMFRQDVEVWAGELLPGAVDLLQAVGRRYVTACFSNTNPVHWPYIRDKLGLGRMLTHHFLSYEIGYVKPAAEAYRHVVRELGVDPSAVLFLDDSRENVEAGNRVGFNSHIVEGPAGVYAKLSELGLDILQGTD